VLRVKSGTAFTRKTVLLQKAKNNLILRYGVLVACTA
jgi:hypothetical protein